MSVLDTSLAAARNGAARVVLPETGDARILEAARMLAGEGIAVSVPLSDPSDAMVEAIAAIRPMKTALIRRLLEKPLYRAAAMVAIGEADALIAGAATPTKRVIEAASLAIGMAEGVATPSSFFLMKLPGGRELVFADCAVNVAPDAAQLSHIAIASARSATALLGEAHVAMLSFSTGASGSGGTVDLVRAATAHAQAAGLNVTGPVQADAALNAQIAAAKGHGTGRSNTLIFPSLDAGNIAYKLLRELGSAQAVGPFLQGFRRPVCDLSRGASVADIVAATAVTLAMR